MKKIILDRAMKQPKCLLKPSKTVPIHQRATEKISDTGLVPDYRKELDCISTSIKKEARPPIEVVQVITEKRPDNDGKFCSKKEFDEYYLSNSAQKWESLKVDAEKKCCAFLDENSNNVQFLNELLKNDFSFGSVSIARIVNVLSKSKYSKTYKDTLQSLNSFFTYILTN